MPAIALIFNAFVWGVSWFPFRQIERHGLHPVWATCLVYVAITAVMALLRRNMLGSFLRQPGLVLLGLAAGFGFAVTNILLRRLRDAPGQARALAMFGGCAVIAAATAWAGSALGAIPATGLGETGWWGWAAVLGAGFVFANICLQYGAARLAANVTSVIMLSEVLFASVSSVALGASTMTARIWAGGALIVLAAAWSAFARTPNGEDDRRTAFHEDTP